MNDAHVLFVVNPVMLVVSALVTAGVVALTIAVVNERRMQQHRQPDVSYWKVTLRRDGAWRRTDLFTDDGLAFQGRAAKWGMIGVGCFVLAMILWAVGMVK